MARVLQQLVSISVTFLSVHIYNMWRFLSSSFASWVHSVILEMPFVHQTLFLIKFPKFFCCVCSLFLQASWSVTVF